MKNTSDQERSPTGKDRKSLIQSRQAALGELFPLSGKEILDRIAEHDNPVQFIQQLPSEDFFWLVKKVGDDDCLSLLKLATEDQWQYLLDLEVWRKDRLKLEQAFQWIERLHLADPVRLVKWFFSKGQYLAYYYLFKSIQVVEINEEDDEYDLKKGFFSFEGVFYISVLHDEQSETIQSILKTMAGEDLERYQALLLGLAGVLPAEIEEEMYRWRNVRLAEHGFLPFEEALSVYSPLEPGVLSVEEQTVPQVFSPDKEPLGIIPVSPLYHAMGYDLLTATTSGITDSLLLDRVRLEFAGLCNQILSADGTVVDDLEILIKTCRKASAYLNLALEKLCGKNIPQAEKLLKGNPLLSVFRVGFGLVLELKWKTERWIKESWFRSQGLEFGFWGDEWGETLSGLMGKKPRRYVGLEEGEEYGEFERLSELEECRGLMRHLIAVDKLFGQLTGRYPLENRLMQDPHVTFHKPLFTLWARLLLKLEPCFLAISPAQAKEFLGLLRGGEKQAPYRMTGFEEEFVNDFIEFSPDLEPDTQEALKDALSLIWEEFREEYASVPAGELDRRFVKFFWVTPLK